MALSGTEFLRSHARKIRMFFTKISVSRLKQAAEKAIKAVLVAGKIPYPYTHDINALLSVLEQNGIAFP